MKKPNIVIFCTDEQPFHWLGCMGNKDLKTPNIDALAKDGTLFTNAFCNTPICMASRATMFTGLPGSTTGCRTNGIPLDDHYPTLPQILKDSGYHTMSTGKIHLSNWEIGTFHAPGYQPPMGDFPESETHWRDGSRTHIEDGYFGLDNIDFIGNHGWYCHGDYTNWLRDNHPDQYEKFVGRESAKPSLDYDDKRYGTLYGTFEDEYYYNQWIKDRTIEKLEKAPEDKPFFAWISYPDPHWPYGPAEPYSTMYDPNTIDPPVAWDDLKSSMPDFYRKEWYEERNIPSVDGQDTHRSYEQIMEAKALSYGMTTAIDTSIGQIVEYLKATNRYEDTILVFMSDHGDAMGDHRMFNKGPFHYDGVIRVPLVMAYPAKMKKGQVSHGFAQTLDFMPTILDLAGVDYPAPQVPDWQGFAPENFPLYDENSLSRLVGNSLKPILLGDQNQVQDYVLLEDDDDIRRIMVRTLVTEDYKLSIFMGRTDGILFDRKQDPEERYNLWDNPSYTAAQTEMMEKMSQALIKNIYRGRRRISIA